MDKEEEKYFLVTQRDALASASAGVRRSEKFEVHYTKLGVKKTLSRKANTSPSDDGTWVEANQFYQYCVVDEKDRLVKPKKITKKGKNLRVDINDTHFVELLNFFGRDKTKDGVTKFVSHINRETRHFEAINSVDGQLVELTPDHQDVAWCSRAGFIAAPEPAGYDIYAAEDLRYGQIYTLLPVVPAPVVVAADEVAVAALPSLLPSFSPWVSGGAAATALLSRGGGSGAAAAAAAATPVSPVVADLVVHGHIMLGPLVAGTDLQVTAYDAAGNKLPSSTGNPVTVTPNGTGGFDYAITITGGYRGVVTVRLSNPGGNLDYVSEFTATQINLGTGALLGSDNVPTSENEWIINITQATDLAARRVLSAASADTDAPQLAAGVQASDVTDANIAVTNALLPASAGTRITQLLPKSTIGTDGQSSGDTSDYALLLHTLDVVAQQAATSANPLTLQQVQTNISKLLTWPNADYKTATLQTQLPLLDTTKTDAANNVWVPSLAATFEQNENVATTYLAAVKPADIPINPATGQPYQVTYQITGGSDKGLFDINPNTGQLTWKTAPDYEAPKDQGADNTYQVIVTAVTNAPLTSAYLSSSQVVTIKVNNVAETTTPVVPVTPVTPVVPDLVIQGQGMFGPIVVGTDLEVTAYKGDGTVLGSTTVVPDTVQDGRTYNYKITVVGQGNYRGPVTVRLTNGGPKDDYVSESTGQAKNLADGALLATDVVTTNWVTSTVNLKIINITQATDLAARKVLDATTVDDSAKAPVVKATEAQVTDANIAITDALVPSEAGKSVPITQLLPRSTIKTDGTSSGDTSDYALLLHSMDVITQSQPLADPTPLKTTQQKLFGLLTWPDTVNEYKTAVLPVAPLVDTIDAAQPESSLITLTVAENSPTTALTYDASVKASKVPAGATVTYAITGGGDAAKFDIDPVTGVLTLKNTEASPNFDDPLDFGKDNVYDVIITASTDTPLATGYLRASQAVKFKITNLPDAPPIFLDNTTPGTKIADSTPLDVTVPSGTLTAYIPNVKFDDAADSKLYTLTGGVAKDQFNINGTTGVVSFKSTPIAWNADKTYVIEVTVADTKVRQALIDAGVASPATADYTDTQTVNIKVQKLLTQETIDSFNQANTEIPGPGSTVVANPAFVSSQLKYQDDNFVIKFTVPVSLTADSTKKLHFVDETGTLVHVDVDLTDPNQATLSADGKTLTLYPPADLSGDSNYHIEFDAGALLIGGQAVPALTGENHGLDFSTQPPFTLHLAKTDPTHLTDLEVTSAIVLTTGGLDPIATAVAGKKIRFTNLADSGTKTGFAGEAASHDFVIDAADKRYVTILANGNVSIKPPFDFDFANHYQITIDAGAFSTAADANGKVRSILAPETDAIQKGALVFSTVNVAANFAAIDATVNTGYVMQNDGTLVANKQWFAVDSTTAADPALDLSSGAYAMVFKDADVRGVNPSINDGAATYFDVTVTDFGSNDLIYADDQNNDPAQMNDSRWTQIIDAGGASDLQADVRFDPVTAATPATGGTFHLSLQASGAYALTEAQLIDKIRVTNANLATPITAIERVDATGTVIASNKLDASITDAQPLHIKVSAALESGDTLQLRYIDGAGQEQNLGMAYTVSTTDATHQYATLDVSRTLLNQLPEQEGYNRIFAQLVSLKTGGVTYSRVLGGDSGVYLDTLPDTPVLSVKPGLNVALTQDAVLTNDPADQVTLVAKAASLTLGSTLRLFDDTNTQVGADHVIDASSLNTDLELTTLTNSNLGFGAHTYTLKSTDAALNTAATSLVVTRNEYVPYNGTVGLGPVLTGNDLKVTAYKSDGTVLGTALVTTNGTFSVNIDKAYTGAITLSVANKGSSTATADYRDESTNTDLDIGTGMLSAIVYANGTAKTVHITPLTDLVARQLADAATHQVVAGVTAAQINAYNLQLAKLFGVSSTQSITDVLPTFVLDTAGTLASTTQLKHAYAQTLAQISDQAVVNIQDQLANAINWSWNSGTSTATATATGDIVKQVLLLTKVAQAEALATGANGSSYLTLANLTDYGITGLDGLSLARTDNLIQRIVDAADDGSAFDTVAELQALANKVAALSKIQDYAHSNTNPKPVLADYTAAGLTGVSASNLDVVNSKVLNNANFKGAASDPVADVAKEALMQTALNTWVDGARSKIASYANASTNPAPTMADYDMAGLSGVTADNLAKVNAVIDAIAPGGVATTPAVDTLQHYVDTAVDAYNQAVLKVRAYMRDTVPNPAPDATTFADLGLSDIDTANEVASANYYLGTLMGTANADASQSLIRTNLTAQWKALEKINQYAIDNNNTAPVKADYIAAGVVWNTNSDQALFNATVDAKDSIDTAKALVDLLNTVASPSGSASLSSIVRAGSSVANGSFTSDAYLNAAELGAGETAQFTVTFDRAVTGLREANFALSDALGSAIAGAASTLTLSSADANAGRLYTVTVSNLTGLSSKSLRLNLANTTGVTDTQGALALPAASYTGGQSYTVDTSNPVTLAAATGEDLTLSSSEASVNLWVDPANLSVGDVLQLTKGDGSLLGSAVTVNATHLSSGVTFNVLKSILANGDTLTVKSTDIAGNSGSASITVNVLDYVQVTGSLGLPSKVLTGNDLQVTAYDASNNVLGTGTIDAATNTYTLQLLQSTTGRVKLQLSSGIGSAKDFWDEATAAQADLGSMAISAVINADGTAKTSNISVLTDVAARLIAGISSPTAADISAANLAVTKLLVNSTSATGITAYTPDFGVGNSGTYSTSTASLYGQLLNQLSQQAQSKGRALDVVLEDLAAGISYNSTTGVATLNNAFAKEVFLLAKVQMAAALSTGTPVPASVLSAQDLIDGGVTGMSGANDPRMTDLLARIVATSDDGNAVDTLAELQALADKVVAIAKIQDYASLNTKSTPTVADYVAAGYSTVTTDNLTAVNAQVESKVASDITTDALLQTVVDNGVAAFTAAVAKIAAYANLNTNPAPTLADYVNAGVVNMTSFAVYAVNQQVDSAAQTDADTTAKIQALVNTGIVINQDNIQVIQNYHANPVTHDAPTLAQYQLANLAAITTAAQVANANALLSQTLQDQSLSDAALATRLSQQITALQTLSDYAQHGGTAPSTDTYTDAGIAGVTSTNLAEVNARMSPGSAFTTTAQILVVLKAVDLDSHTLGIASSSQTLVSDSNAHAVFADMALSYADGIQSIKVKVTGADTVNDQFIFGTVTKAINDNALTGSGLTLNGVSGVSWAYSSSGKQLVFTRDDGNTFSAAQAQSIEQALQFKTAELTNQTERDFSLTHLYADGSSTTAVTAKFLVDTAPQVQTGAFDVNTQTLQLGFDEVLNIGTTPLITDFSNLQVGGASATVSSVNLNDSADHLILALASSAFSDSVVSFHYAANTAAYRLTSAATGASVDSFTAVIDQALHNSTLVGSANEHNVIVGNGGADTLTGGDLSDLFIFGANTSGTSTITNFDFTQFDKLDLSGFLDHVTTGQEAQYLQLSNTAAGDLQIKIDKDGQSNFTTGLDATLVLTGNGHISANTGTELLNHFIKTNTFVL